LGAHNAVVHPRRAAFALNFWGDRASVRWFVIPEGSGITAAADAAPSAYPRCQGADRTPLGLIEAAQREQNQKTKNDRFSTTP